MSRNRGFLCGLGTAFGFVLTATVATVAAAAADGHVAVTLDFGIEPTKAVCNDELSFRRAVADRVGYDPFQQGAEHRIEIRSTLGQQGLVGSIAWRDFAGRIEGERKIDAPDGDCTALLNNMAFAVVVQLQLFNSMRAIEPAKSAPKPLPPVPEPLVLRPTPPIVRQHPYFAFGFGTELGYGLLPHPNWMAALYTALGQGSIALRLGAELSLPETWQQPDGAGFRSHLYLLSAAPCFSSNPVSLCAIGRVGSFSVQGFGVDEPHHSSGTVAWLGLRLALDFSIATHWKLGWQADAARNVNGFAVTLNDAPAWVVPSVAVTNGIYVSFSTE